MREGVPIANYHKRYMPIGLAFVGEINMFRFLKNHIYPIGMDIGYDSLKLVQLGNNGKGISLIAGGSKNRPAHVEPGSANWQKWAIEAIRELSNCGKFRGREVIATIPANEVFIEHIKMPKIKEEPGSDDKLQDALLPKIKQKLPFEPDDAMIKYIPAEEDNVLVIAAERKKINRHLAIYEKAQLAIKSITVWPTALANSYAEFFGRRKTDIEAIVMLLDIEVNCTNVVICRAKTPLFARSIPIGASQLGASQAADETMTRLILELTGCRRQFSSMHRKAQAERLIFLSGRAVDKGICTTIAKQLEMPAQMGDCLAAVEMVSPYDSGIDRRGCQINWATAFGLGLS